MAQKLSCWLVKSEPSCFSIYDLEKSPNQTTSWDGVRNYQARNFMRDSMKLGDRVLYYHSSTDPPAVAGTAVVVREAYPDNTAWDPQDQHYDPKSSPDNPIWQMVDIKLEEVFAVTVPIGTLREVAALKNMELLRTGSRLSVQPVTNREFDVIVELAHAAAERGASENGRAGQTRSATSNPQRPAARKRPAAKAATRAKSTKKAKARRTPARKKR